MPLLMTCGHVTFKQYSMVLSYTSDARHSGSDAVAALGVSSLVARVLWLGVFLQLGVAVPCFVLVFRSRLLFSRLCLFCSDLLRCVFGA